MISNIIFIIDTISNGVSHAISHAGKERHRAEKVKAEEVKE